MDNNNITYAIFPFEWTVKSTSYQIRYSKAFDLNEIDEIFCTILGSRENRIKISDLAILLGFNLNDLAEIDILNIYLNNLTEFNLIEINEDIVQLTLFGQAALHSKLKYKYYFASTELFENQTATGENIHFSFKQNFDLENILKNKIEDESKEIDDSEILKKLQFQLFKDDIYKGEILEVYEGFPNISYKNIPLQIEVTPIENEFKISIFKSGIEKQEIKNLIYLDENAEFKGQLIRKGIYQHILVYKDFIRRQDIEVYSDLCNWKELVENPKIDWNDNSIFDLFLENGNGSIWTSITEKAPIEIIKSVIHKYVEYWDWNYLSKNLPDEFIESHIEDFNWDFEELSYKSTPLVISLLSNLNLKDRNWDWSYLSQNLPDEFIESHIEDFNWDFYVITESKSSVFKNTFINYRDKPEKILSKNWNWNIISEEINLNFLYKNIVWLSSKLNWHILLRRFFSNEKLTNKCLKDPTFKLLLKEHLPGDYIVAHQKYLWSIDLIDFLQEQDLIQWETKKYINGFDTNETVEWNRPVFEKYHTYIKEESGFLNVSRSLSDYSLIIEYPQFAWNWEGISQNKILLSNSSFIERAFIGELSFTDNLKWNEILINSNLDVNFWNNNLEAFFSATESEKQTNFWKSLTKKETFDFIFANKHFPWDWSFITENCSEEVILDSYEDEALFEKWDWKIATRKFDKNSILELLEDLAKFVDWKYLINEVFTVENELAINNDLPKIAAYLTVLDPENRKEIWKDITVKFPFENLFPILVATIESDIFEWDWEYISAQKNFPTDIRTLNRFKEKIHWTTFSESTAIRQKFNPDGWNNRKLWFDNIDRYLHQFEDYWDWQVLSKNNNINYNRLLLTKYKNENWDWVYLSEFGGFITEQKRDRNTKNYLEGVIKQFPNINFEALSKRRDIGIKSDLIVSTKNKGWDWQVLSENEKAEITIELILELKNKNWSWQALSKRKNIDFNNESLLQLIDKDWDWNYLSTNENLVFNAELIESTKTKPWNWNSISRHNSFLPTVEILKLVSDFDLDWPYLSQHDNLILSKDLLAKFENKWDWTFITRKAKDKFEDILFLERFVDKWDWHYICESGKLNLNSQILNKFKDYLDWTLISSNTNIFFTKEIIQSFKNYWDWSRLKDNKRVVELLGSYVTNELKNDAILNFIDNINQQSSHWKGSIYHFSHIDNAVEIIKKRKIQSRNKAVIKGDAAGKVVHRRGDAHNYARFYFRPHTPTQFYNEFLGKNTKDGYETHGNWVSWYEKARDLGFPKCPVPIFFKFSIKEVLFKYENKCCVSNGNMQADSTQFNSIPHMLNKFNFEYLYSEMKFDKEHNKKYRNFSQQEFLVKDELSFDDLSDFEIVCPSESDRILLIKLLGQENKDIFQKIKVYKHYYNNQNPRVRIEEEDAELHISTHFNGDGYFVLNGSSLKEVEILLGDVTKSTNNKIIFKSNISIGNVKQNIQLNFIDESNRNWFLFAKNESSANI